MDVSKLPRLSETPPPPESQDVAERTPAPVMDYRSAPQPGVGAEAWLAAIVGLVLMLLAGRFAGYLLATLTGQTYHTNVMWTVPGKEDQEVGYWELEGYTALSEAGIFVFGFAMVLEGIMLLVIHSRARHKRPLVTAALLSTIAATVLNLVVAIVLLRIGITPLLSLLAVAFGGYVAAYEWRLVQSFGSAQKSAPDAGKTSGAQGR